jgi:hypothetical protein
MLLWAFLLLWDFVLLLPDAVNNTASPQRIVVAVVAAVAAAVAAGPR